MREIARESGVSYDTLLRIRDGETDPGYSKVAALHRAMFATCPDCKKSREAA